MATNFQDILLSAVRKDSIPVTVYLTTGFQLRGVVRAFDNYVLIMEVDGKQQMVYKHAISTIVPIKAVIKITQSKPKSKE